MPPILDGNTGQPILLNPPRYRGPLLVPGGTTGLGLDASAGADVPLPMPQGAGRLIPILSGGRKDGLPAALPTGDQGSPSILSTNQNQSLPIPSVSPADQLGRDQSRLNYIRNSGTGISQIGQNVDAQGNATDAHPGFWKTLGKVGATVGDDLLRVAAPGAERLIPGGYGRHQDLLAQSQQAVTSDQQQMQAAAQLQDSQAQASQRQALAVQEQAKAQALTHPKPTNGQLLYDKTGSAIGFQGGDGSYMGPNDPNLPYGVGDILSAAQRKQPTNAFELWQQQNPKGSAEDYLTLSGQGKVKALPEQYNEALAAGDHGTAQRILKVIHDTNTQPKIDIHQADQRPAAGPRQMIYVPQPDGSSRAMEVTPGMAIPAGAMKTPGGQKINADEQKRADLAQNLNENIDKAEEIIGRRPELVGPVAGRWTQLKNAFGSDDPDVSALIAIQHQLGMVAQGAHGMRSAQGVETAANSLLNSFHNSPAATRAALETARQSVQTFLKDSQQPGRARGVTVNMMAPDGSVQSIPVEQMEHYKSLGAKVVQ